MRALSMIRAGLDYRRGIFQKGLEANGYAVSYQSFKPEPEDLLIIWNRYGHYAKTADVFEAAGATVLVVENGYLGKNYKGSDWYAISKNHHNGGGDIPYNGVSRFTIGFEGRREAGSEILLLPQRGIGEKGVAMPRTWERGYKHRFPEGYTVRPHRGKQNKNYPLEDDLKRARAVITWGSGAALKAICAGVPCVHCFKDWIGAPASTYIDDVKDWGNIPYINPSEMLSRLSWAMWNSEEIESGYAFKELLK